MSGGNLRHLAKKRDRFHLGLKLHQGGPQAGALCSHGHLKPAPPFDLSPQKIAHLRLQCMHAFIHSFNDYFMVTNSITRRM